MPSTVDQIANRGSSMPEQPINQNHSLKASRRVQIEFVEFLLQEEALYPWQLNTLEGEEFLRESEQQISFLEDLEPETLAAASQTFLAQMQQCWLSQEPKSLLQSLSERFGNLVPSNWLEEIVKQAQQVSSTSMSLEEQLIALVEPLLNGWEQEDLQVFARPWVYATRKGEATDIESMLQVNEQDDWQNLSPIKQARYSMAIAHYALSQLQNR